MLQRKKSRESQPKFLKSIVDCLLGAETPRLWLTEFFGESEAQISQAALGKVSRQQVIAYLDPFENLHLQDKKPDLILKPVSQEQAIAMTREMLQSTAIDIVMIDSLFLLPSEGLRLEECLIELVQVAERCKKPVFLLNPNNGARRLLEKNLKTFCSSQICV